MKRVNFWIIAINIFDRIIKTLVLKYEINIDIIPTILKFIFTPNYGIAFGYMARYNFLIIIANITIISLISIYLLNFNLKDKFEVICLNTIIAGSISNLFDRIVYGYVIDYISLIKLPIFNIADICIVFGSVLLITKIKVDLNC